MTPRVRTRTNAKVFLNQIADHKVTPETIDQARLVVASYANDADDCRLLFEVLGLNDYEMSDE